MNKPEIYILTGEKHSGKTTRLQKLIENRKDVYGVLTPDIDGRRFFVNVETKETFPMEADANESDVLAIGKYKFSKASFDKAKDILEKAGTQTKGWLIIDEAGPLELKGSGFYSSIVKLLETKKPGLKIILVVRQSLVDEMMTLFNIGRYEIITDHLPE